MGTFQESYLLLLDALVPLRHFKSAYRVLQQMERGAKASRAQVPPRAYEQVLQVGCNMRGGGEAVLGIFDGLMAKGVVPTLPTWTHLITALGKSAMAEQVWEVYAYMKEVRAQTEPPRQKGG